jgi:hypothetical protein
MKALRTTRYLIKSFPLTRSYVTCSQKVCKSINEINEESFKGLDGTAKCLIKRLDNYSFNQQIHATDKLFTY